MKFFIDTEFTDFIDRHLISIGMVAENGKDLFYAEVPFPEDSCSDFVRETVVPLLGARPGALVSIDTLGSAILSWLDGLRGDGVAVIAFDYSTDWSLFARLLGGPIPSWCQPLNIFQSIEEVARLKYYRDTGLPEHHALNDALANWFAHRPKDKETLE